MNKLIIIGVVILCLLAVGVWFFQTSMKTAQEERIVYENQVIKNIDTQLKDLPMEAIRKKAPLIMEQSIAEIQSAIANSKLTYVELTAFYLDRIKMYDKSNQGINAIMDINPQAIAQARQLDAEQATDKSPIYGMPILLKDNINTKDMPTSGGTIALKDFIPAENAPLVDNLIRQKAIILGKANLSELANFMDIQMPSGYSSKLGQTHNPFDPLMISPLGSSSGSAAAVASNMCAAALGTETTGSIISPAYIHSIVGFKPTKDHIIPEGVIPLSSTMDTVGPMTKSVQDAVALYNATIQDPAKAIKLDTTISNLNQKRIGVFKDDTSSVLVDALKKAGAEVVELDLESENVDNDFIIYQDFKPDFAAYAQKYNAPVKSLKELVAFNKQDLDKRAKYDQTLLEKAAEDDGANQAKVKAAVASEQAYVQKLMNEHKLDAISFVNANGCTVPCIAGYPEITVPLGIDSYNEPTGATFFAPADEDQKLAQLAYAFEQATKLRQIPQKYLESNQN